MKNEMTEEKAINFILGLGALWAIYKVVAIFWKFALVRTTFWAMVLFEISTHTVTIYLN